MKHDFRAFNEAMIAAASADSFKGPAGSKLDFAWSAAHDSLTGLANRRYFEAALDQRLHDAHTTVGLLMIDMDYFKQVNDGYGHAVGDQMLCRLAERIGAGIRRTDLAARIGGDEFAVILNRPKDAAAFEARSAELVRRLCQPMLLDGHRVPCSVSVGLAVTDGDCQSRAELLRNADVALYRAKSDRGRLIVFDEHLRADLLRKTEIEARARKAIQSRRIFPCYQPKVDLLTGEVIGFEALMRWKSNDGDLETPEKCPQVLEDPYLAQLTIETMLARVLTNLGQWQVAGVAKPVAVNVTDSDLRRAGFAHWFLTCIAKAHLPAALIEVEITEDAPLSRNPGQIAEVLQQLSAGGIRIALDDFGTGNSSLVHLKHFPIDQVKIDKSFIAGLVTDPDDRAIVSSVLALAASLSMEVVAEGIESRAQCAILRRDGCRIGQGHLLGVPQPAAGVPRLVKEGVPDMALAAAEIGLGGTRQ